MDRDRCWRHSGRVGVCVCVRSILLLRSPKYNDIILNTMKEVKLRRKKKRVVVKLLASVLRHPSSEEGCRKARLCVRAVSSAQRKKAGTGDACSNECVGLVHLAFCFQVHATPFFPDSQAFNKTARQPRKSEAAACLNLYRVHAYCSD